ncbi:MAG TPA: hypothetical protein VGO97_01955 [Solirubrobacterales bacterium]|jgi:predicted lipoprotein with Yx(FWY)xxD motif|nr:hypothetical protein [Solirubrobacterales bacterium]
MNSKLTFVVAIMAVAAAAIAGCGSSNDNKNAADGTYGAPATPATSTATKGRSAAKIAVAVVDSKSDPKWGTILADVKGRTIYIFEADKPDRSNCSSACATVWPPLTTRSKAKAKGRTVSSKLGMIKRADGRRQVTYNGQPLYTYATDKDSADAYGQNLSSYGADWYVVAPNGKKVEGKAKS